MAFKMKGSAFKLNNVATKSAMKSPLEQGDPMVDPKAARTEAMEGDLGKSIKDALFNIKMIKENAERRGEDPTKHPGWKLQHDILAKLRANAQKPGSEASYITGEPL